MRVDLDLFAWTIAFDRELFPQKLGSAQSEPLNPTRPRTKAHSIPPHLWFDDLKMRQKNTYIYENKDGGHTKAIYP